MPPSRLLIFNTGSSSIKLAWFEIDGARARLLMQAAVDLHGEPLRALMIRDGDGGTPTSLALDAEATSPPDEVLRALLDRLDTEGHLQGLTAAAHRVVHGGMRFLQPVMIDDDVLSALEDLVPLAPLHQPRCLAPVRALAERLPHLPQTASFDTVFHAGQAEVVRRFALPRHLYDLGIRRYGFHGLSYAHLAGRLVREQPAIAAGRVVVAHLGSGSSLCAIDGGRSVDTSMGFSVLDGVPMATRCGATDPGVLLHLMQQQGLDADALQAMLYHQSGLLGISGHSGDMRALKQRDDPASRMALQIFALRCAGEVARLATTLGGIDALVFTAGIGEHDAAARAAIAAHLGWLGLGIDADANRCDAERIDSAGSRIPAFVLAADEAQQIADEALVLLSGA